MKTSTFSYDTAKAYIAMQSGIVMVHQGYPLENLGYHAMALVGVASFSDNTYYYVVWNPWWNDITVIDSATKRMTFTDGSYYQWIESVVNF